MTEHLWFSESGWKQQLIDARVVVWRNLIQAMIQANTLIVHMVANTVTATYLIAGECGIYLLTRSCGLTYTLPRWGCCTHPSIANTSRARIKNSSRNLSP